MSKLFPDCGILYVDDERKSLKYFEASFRHIAPIFVAEDPVEGFHTFVENKERIALVLSDKKMPNESGLDFLGRVRDHDPRPLRFLVTAFSDLDLAVDCLNNGLLYSYLTKPWDPTELEHRLTEAVKHFSVERERDRLIAEKSAALNQLVMADKAASIGILSSGLNHHLRNSLTVLRTFFDMLPYQIREELGSEPKDASFWSEYYGEVGSQIERMTSMLGNLAEGANEGLPKLNDEIDLSKVVAEAIDMVKTDGPEVAISAQVDDCVPQIIGDRQKIVQLVRFLLHDAMKGTKGSQRVDVEVRQGEGESSVLLAVLNDGELVPKEELPHLFDPFFVRSNNPEELGTHLLACYLTVFHHGGQIRAGHSRDGRNRIEVALPEQPGTELLGAHHMIENLSFVDRSRTASRERALNG
ncbi:MAG: hybrid sensor histidine kinase/response regulator [Verrucomicrobiota bacterium]